MKLVKSLFNQLFNLCFPSKYENEEIKRTDLILFGCFIVFIILVLLLIKFS